MKWRILIAVLLVLTCRFVPGGAAPGQAPALELNLTGMLDGTAYEILVPVGWNGTLLVFAHGIQTAAPTPVSAPPPVKNQLLAAGYALAGSGFPNSYKEGVLRTHQLTGFFREAVGIPSRVIVWGNSMGGGIALKLIEQYPGNYHGAIANCAVSAGNGENLDSALSFALAYDAAFGWREDLWGPIEDVRDDLTNADVLPFVPWAPAGTMSPGPPKWEFIRMAMHLPPEAFWVRDPVTTYEFYKLQMWKATVVRSWNEAENGGPVAGNSGMVYTVDEDDATLASLGLTRQEVDEMLGYMNARANIVPDGAARNHVDQWGTPTGRLRRPVLTMKYKYDGMAPVAHESYYRDLLEAAGNGHRLVQTFTDAPAGHCMFTPAQYQSALGAMESWLNTGVRPDQSFFPAARGFNLTFTPGPWIF